MISIRLLDAEVLIYMREYCRVQYSDCGTVFKVRSSKFRVTSVRFESNYMVF